MQSRNRYSHSVQRHQRRQRRLWRTFLICSGIAIVAGILLGLMIADALGWRP